VLSHSCGAPIYVALFPERSVVAVGRGQGRLLWPR